MAFHITGTKFRAFTDSGVPLALGRLYTFVSGTTTNKPVYTDSTLSSPQTYIADDALLLYIALDARGECDCWLSPTGAYTFRVTTSGGLEIDTQDGIVSPDYVGTAVKADLASTDSGKGAALVGADPGVDYPDDTIGFLVVRNTSNGYNALRGFSKAEQTLIQAGTSSSDHAATLDSMLASEKHLFLPRGTWRRTTAFDVGSGLTLEGAGINQTYLLLTADVEGVRAVGSHARIGGFTLNKTGSHTKAGIINGTTALKCDRNIFRDIYVSGMGAHGVKMVNGNICALYNVHGNSNAGWGLYFNRDASVVDNHGHYIDGSCNWNGNTAGGVSFTAGTSASDGTAPKSNTGRINAQNNTGRGVYIGTSKNDLEIYAESNGSDNCYLDQYAAGVRLHVIEGTVVGNLAGVAASVDSCLISYANHNANYRAGFKSKVEVSGGTGKGFRIAGDDGTAGFVEIEKQAARELRIIGSGSGAAWNTYFSHSSGTGVLHQINVGGGVVPMADNAAGYTLGTASLRWATASIVELRPGAGAVKWSSGTGSPEGVYAGPVGSLYTRTDGGASTTLYVKESGTGNTGWVAK